MTMRDKHRDIYPDEVIAKLYDEIERLRGKCECYEAMKEGVQIRIADLQAEIERLREELEKERSLREELEKVFESRMDAEEAADFCFLALCEANNDADVRRAFELAEEKWPWLQGGE